MSKNSKLYGRGEGSFRMSQDDRQERKMRASFKLHQRITTFDPLKYITSDCKDEKEVQIFKQVFDYLDSDRDGVLTPHDLIKALRQYGGYRPQKSFVYIAMSLLDLDDGGQISFKEFVKLMTIHPCETDTEYDIERVYTQIDEGNKGYISIEDLKNCAEELKEELTNAEFKQMIRKCDPKGDGVITKEAFIAFNKKRQFKAV